MRCYGNDWVQAPSLNALASQSFVFENAYVSQPVCTPARSTIMTGTYPHTSGLVVNGVSLRPEARTIAEMASDDYLCAYYGKWHLGNDLTPQHGFDRWLSIEDTTYIMTERPYRFSDYHQFLVGRGLAPRTDALGARIFSEDERSRMPLEHHQSTYLGDQASRFLREIGDQPFILFVSFVEPHSPYTGPAERPVRPGRAAGGPRPS